MTTLERYIRNLDTLNSEEQLVLGDARVCIAGLGGLGGGVAEMLARIGVGYLYLVDGDIFSMSNLNRQLFSTEKLIGTHKTDAAALRINDINSNIHVRTFRRFLTLDSCEDIFDEVDVVVDCLDSIDDRFMIQEAAHRSSIPLVSGAIAGTSGQVTTIFPQDKGFELIYGTHYEKNLKGIETRVGNLSFCALFVASIQASEVVKLLLNRGEVLRNKLFIADLMSNSYEIMDLK
ncbi:MAG: HesA/MoeB/ThiF family protein [Desulfamplus sp.]|nr:HesA/MoeB/ThiF family protein [Desulfamplus sp.]MBF0257273.1 HesA/MoeB/ThiF family protein [Desulfamplus sp.]